MNFPFHLSETKANSQNIKPASNTSTFMKEKMKNFNEPKLGKSKQEKKIDDLKTQQQSKVNSTTESEMEKKVIIYKDVVTALERMQKWFELKISENEGPKTRSGL